MRAPIVRMARIGLQLAARAHLAGRAQESSITIIINDLQGFSKAGSGGCSAGSALAPGAAPTVAAKWKLEPPREDHFRAGSSADKRSSRKSFKHLKGKQIYFASRPAPGNGIRSKC